MLKSGLIFVASLVAVLSMGSAYAADPADTADTNDTVATEHTVYGTSTLPGATGYVTSGIAGVTYVNRMVNVAGNAAQKAEDHAAAAGKSALDAATAAANAQTAAENAQTTANNVANKVSIAQGGANKNKAVITDASGNITTGQIKTDMIEDGAVTIAKTTGIFGYIPTKSDGTGSAQIWVE